MVNTSEELNIEKILQYSGFVDSAQRTIFVIDRFDIYDVIFTIGDTYIVNLAKGFSDKTFAAGKIIFGLRRTNPLKANIHWDQDFRRISWIPSLIGISKATKLRAEIEAAS